MGQSSSVPVDVNQHPRANRASTNPSTNIQTPNHIQNTKISHDLNQSKKGILRKP